MFSGLSGTGGVLKVAGRSAATLTGWTVAYDPSERVYVVRASVTDVVPVYLADRYRYEVRLQMVKRMWRWLNASVSIDGDIVTARVTGEPDVM